MKKKGIKKNWYLDIGVYLVLKFRATTTTAAAKGLLLGYIYGH